MAVVLWELHWENMGFCRGHGFRRGKKTTTEWQREFWFSPSRTASSFKWQAGTYSAPWGKPTQTGLCAIKGGLAAKSQTFDPPKSSLTNPGLSTSTSQVKTMPNKSMTQKSAVLTHTHTHSIKLHSYTLRYFIHVTLSSALTFKQKQIQQLVLFLKSILFCVIHKETKLK